MEEAPHNDPKDELLELGFEGDGSDPNICSNQQTSDQIDLHGNQESTKHYSTIPTLRPLKSKHKPRIKLQDSRYGEWKKGYLERQSLPIIQHQERNSNNEEMDTKRKHVVHLTPADGVVASPKSQKPRQVSPLIRSTEISKVTPPIKAPECSKAHFPNDLSTKMFRYIKLASPKPNFQADTSKQLLHMNSELSRSEDSRLNPDYLVNQLDQIVIAGEETPFDSSSALLFSMPNGVFRPPLRILHKLKQSRIVKRRVLDRDRMQIEMSRNRLAGHQLVGLASGKTAISEPLLTLHVDKVIKTYEALPAHRKKETKNIRELEQVEQPDLKSSLANLQKKLQELDLLPTVSRTRSMKRSLDDIRSISKGASEQKVQNESSTFSKSRNSKPDVARVVAMPSILGVGFKLYKKGVRSDLSGSFASSQTQATALDTKSHETTPKPGLLRGSKNILLLEQQILRDFRQFYSGKSQNSSDQTVVQQVF